jgi:hypothetical protein
VHVFAVGLDGPSESSLIVKYNRYMRGTGGIAGPHQFHRRPVVPRPDWGPKNYLG